MATDIKLSGGFSMPSWTYQNQEPLDVIGAASRGIDISNKFMDQPNIKRGRKVQAMQQDKVLSGEMPITNAVAGPDGMVTGKFQDQLTYDLDRSLDKSKIAESEASAEYRRAQAANVGATNQSIIDLNNARAQAALGGGIFGAGENGEEIEQHDVVRPDGTTVTMPFVRRKGQLYPINAPSDPSSTTPKASEALKKAYLGNKEALDRVDRAMKAVDENPDAFSFVKGAAVDIFGKLGDAAVQRFDQGGVDARAAVADVGSQKIHDRSGAAVTASEFPRLMPFIPLMTDTPETIKKKLTRFQKEYQAMQEEILTMGGPSLSEMISQDPNHPTSKGPVAEEPQEKPKAPAVDTRIAPSAKTAPAATTPPPKDQLVTGQVYQTKNGPMTWTGTGFVPAP